MNSVKLKAFDKFKTLRNLRLVQLPISGGHAISTAPPPLLNQPSSRSSRQLPAPIFTFVRRITHADDPCSRYEVAVTPPVNLGILYVPKHMAYVVHRFGDYWKTLTPGFHVLNHFVYRVAFVHSLQEKTICIRDQPAITMDNVDILIDGVLTVKIVDPALASYKNVYPLYAVTLLAHTTVREEAGKITLEKTSKEAGTLQEKIVIAINEIAKDWGVKCLRYEIRNISQPGGGFRKLLKKLIG